MVLFESPPLQMALLWLVLLFPTLSFAVHVEYGTPKTYKSGDAIPLELNKLTSPLALSTMDANHLVSCPISGGISAKRSPWQRAMDAWHGDFWQPGPAYELRVQQDLYCQSLLCLTTTMMESQQQWESAIQHDMHWNIHVDGLPVVVRTETPAEISTRYWGGIPVGYREDDDNQAYIYNHWNIEVWYSGISGEYQIERTIVEPFSIQHDAATVPESCAVGSTVHTSYDMDWEPQEVIGNITFTYDVIWKKVHVQDQKRWTVFLTMDNAVPLTFQMAGLVLAVLLNVIIYASLIVWMLRDLSYKPIYYDEENVLELNLWPLSTLVFVPPRRARLLLTVLTGTGVHLAVVGFLFIVLFRMGIINQSVGGDQITAGVLLYTLTAWIGGVITGRLAAVFHTPRNRALWTCAATAVGFPFLGLWVVTFCYDVFPGDDAPSYRAFARGWPVWLLWIFVVIPSVLVGGYVGHWWGRIPDFPVASSQQGYQDVHLKLNEREEDQDESKFWRDCGKSWQRWRIGALWLLAGIPPVLCCFIPFSYGVAGPIFLGTYSSTQLISIAPYCLFVTCSGGVSALLYYRQIRTNQYHWWWPAFAGGASSGLYIFILALSWLFFNVNRGQVDGNIFAVFFFWFAWISVGVGCVCGAAGVVACILLNQFLYVYATAGMDFGMEPNDDALSPDTKGTMESTPEKWHEEYGEEAPFANSIVPATFRLASSPPVASLSSRFHEEISRKEDNDNHNRVTISQEDKDDKSALLETKSMPLTPTRNIPQAELPVGHKSAETDALMEDEDSDDDHEARYDFSLIRDISSSPPKPPVLSVRAENPGDPYAPGMREFLSSTMDDSLVDQAGPLTPPEPATPQQRPIDAPETREALSLPTDESLVDEAGPRTLPEPVTPQQRSVDAPGTRKALSLPMDESLVVDEDNKSLTVPRPARPEQRTKDDDPLPSVNQYCLPVAQHLQQTSPQWSVPTSPDKKGCLGSNNTPQTPHSASESDSLANSGTLTRRLTPPTTPRNDKPFDEPDDEGVPFDEPSPTRTSHSPPPEIPKMFPVEASQLDTDDPNPTENKSENSLLL